MISGFYPIGKIFANYTTVDEIILNFVKDCLPHSMKDRVRSVSIRLYS
jgi:hypothetical protein